MKLLIFVLILISSTALAMPGKMTRVQKEVLGKLSELVVVEMQSIFGKQVIDPSSLLQQIIVGHDTTSGNISVALAPENAIDNIDFLTQDYKPQRKLTPYNLHDEDHLVKLLADKPDGNGLLVAQYSPRYLAMHEVTVAGGEIKLGSATYYEIDAISKDEDVTRVQETALVNVLMEDNKGLSEDELADEAFARLFSYYTQKMTPDKIKELAASLALVLFPDQHGLSVSGGSAADNGSTSAQVPEVPPEVQSFVDAADQHGNPSFNAATEVVNEAIGTTEQVQETPEEPVTGERIRVPPRFGNGQKLVPKEDEQVQETSEEPVTGEGIGVPSRFGNGQKLVPKEAEQAKALEAVEGSEQTFTSFFMQKVEDKGINLSQLSLKVMGEHTAHFYSIKNGTTPLYDTMTRMLKGGLATVLELTDADLDEFIALWKKEWEKMYKKTNSSIYKLTGVRKDELDKLVAESKSGDVPAAEPQTTEEGQVDTEQAAEPQTTKEEPKTVDDLLADLYKLLENESNSLMRDVLETSILQIGEAREKVALYRKAEQQLTEAMSAEEVGWQDIEKYDQSSLVRMRDMIDALAGLENPVATLEKAAGFTENQLVEYLAGTSVLTDSEYGELCALMQGICVGDEIERMLEVERVLAVHRQNFSELETNDYVLDEKQRQILESAYLLWTESQVAQQ